MPPQPTSRGSTDQQIEYTQCPNTNHAVLESGTKALVGTGKNKTVDYIVTCEVVNAGTGDELRLYFDHDKYAYFHFGLVDDENYPTEAPTLGGGLVYAGNAASFEGHIGVFDGSQRIGHTSFYLTGATNFGEWFAVWVRASEVEGETRRVATALLGSNSRGSFATARGPNIILDAASAYVTIDNGQCGLGSGQITTGRTHIDRFSVQEGARSWKLYWRNDWTNLEPTDCSYSPHAIANDYYYPCQKYGFDSAICEDGIPPRFVTVQISGIHGGQNTAPFGPFYTDTLCESCDQLNGTYVLERQDIESTEFCQYVYFGNMACGDFAVSLSIEPGIFLGGEFVGVYFSLFSCHSPFYRCHGGQYSMSGWNSTLPHTGTDGRRKCIGPGNDLVGATGSLSEVISWDVGIPNNIAHRGCFEGTITITDVTY